MKIREVFSTIDRLVGRISSAGILLSAIALAAMGALIVIEILARKLFHTSVHIAIEYTGYSLALMMAFSLADVTRRKVHLNVVIVRDRLNARHRRYLELVFSLLLFLGYNIVLTGVCFRLFMQSLELDAHSGGISHTPLWIPQSVLFLGLILADIQVAGSIIQWFKRSTVESGLKKTEG
ncbi:MAG: TRAP transporter small permease [Desulfobacteraceae bacterium]|nr:MAG: TRAP transporter small permease [Desulfobacteraceae bacterium]